MKKIIFVLGILFAISSCDSVETNKKTSQNTKPELELVWQTDTLLTICESTLYDSKSGIVYVSNINNKPWDLDSNGFISTIDTTGKILELKWMEAGLSAPKGMGIFNGKLYVNDIDRVVEIDIETKKILKNYHVGGNPQLNDITVSSDGVVYSSGSSSNTIYALQNGKLDTLVSNDSFDRLNGLLSTKEGIYYISSGSSNFGVFDLLKRTSKVLVNDLGVGDGIVSLSNGDFITTSWKGAIYYIKSSDWSSVKLLDTEKEGVYSADIDFIPEHNILLVPTFFQNKVMAYKLKYK